MASTTVAVTGSATEGCGAVGCVTSLIQGGVNQGMIEMDTSIRALYDEGLVTAQVAYDKAIDKELFKDIIEDATGVAPPNGIPTED